MPSCVPPLLPRGHPGRAAHVNGAVRFFSRFFSLQSLPWGEPRTHKFSRPIVHSPLNPFALPILYQTLLPAVLFNLSCLALAIRLSNKCIFTIVFADLREFISSSRALSRYGLGGGKGLLGHLERSLLGCVSLKIEEGHKASVRREAIRKEKGRGGERNARR